MRSALTPDQENGGTGEVLPAQDQVGTELLEVEARVPEVKVVHTVVVDVDEVAHFSVGVGCGPYLGPGQYVDPVSVCCGAGVREVPVIAVFASADERLRIKLHR